MSKIKSKKKILRKIEKNEVRMIPKWKFEIKNKSLRGLVILGLVLSSLILGILVYWWQLKNVGELLVMGEVGVEVLLRLFPYWLAGLFGVAMSFCVVLWKKIDNNYRKPLEKIALMAALITIIGSLIIILTKDLWELRLWLWLR